jgi:hypothetical protein
MRCHSMGNAGRRRLGNFSRFDFVFPDQHIYFPVLLNYRSVAPKHQAILDINASSMLMFVALSHRENLDAV